MHVRWKLPPRLDSGWTLRPLAPERTGPGAALIAVLVLLLTGLPGAGGALAGTLGDFEDELGRTPEREQRPRPDEERGSSDGRRTRAESARSRHETDDGCSYDGDSIAAFLFVNLLFCPLGKIPARGIALAGQQTHSYRLHREIGHPTLPYVRLDTSYQRLLDDVNGFSVRARGGWSFLGLSAEFLRYREESPADQLDSWSVDGLYRVAPGPRLEAGLALGYREFRGDGSHGGFEVGLPLGFYPLDWLGAEVEPKAAFIESSVLQDYRGGVLVHIPHGLLRAGWRHIRVGDEDLTGPEVTLGAVW